MNGAEDKHITPPGEEPRWLRSLRNIRTAFDLLYVPVVGIAMLIVLPFFLTHPELQTPQGWTAISGALLAAGGLGFRRRQ